MTTQSKNTRKLKIVYVLDDTLDVTDGVQQCVLTIGAEMSLRGHDIHYLVCKTLRDDIKNIHSMTNYFSVSFNENSVRLARPAPTKKIRDFLHSLKPDVLHIQMPYNPLFGGRVVKYAEPSVAIVGTWHTFPAGRVTKLSHIPLSLSLRSTLKRISPTIGVSKPTAEFADSIYGTNSIVVPNAVDISRFQAYKAVKSKNKRIVYLGRFDERKGPQYLIQGLRNMQRSGYPIDNVDVVMGGKGRLREQCIELAKEYGLGIQFPGFISEEDKPTLLASADLCVFPSTGGEAFGISVVEAMASGNSIVLAGDNAGYRSILGEKPELLFDPRDTNEFARALTRYLALPEKELDIKKRWLAESAKQYDVKTVCSQLEDIYTKSLQLKKNGI